MRKTRVIVELPLPKNVSIPNYSLKKRDYLKFCICLVRFPQRQDSYDVTDIVSHTVAFFLANIDQQ